MEEHMKTKKIFILPTILEGKGKIVELLGVMGTNIAWYKGTIQINERNSKYVLRDNGIIDYPRKNDVIRKL